MNDVILSKKESIERCVRQVRQYYQLPSDVPFEQDHMKQDAIATNIQRACEQAIDLANHVIRKRKLGLPQESGDSFSFLAASNIIPVELSKKLRKMIGFRNVLAHQYRDLDIHLMEDVIKHHLDDLLVFSDYLMSEVNEKPMS